MFIRSERLFLRPGWPEDRDDLHGAIADPAVVANLARAPWPYTPEDAGRFLARPEEHALPTFLITLPGPHGTQVIGCVGLHRDGADVELGYWIARPFWGRGYASEAGRAVVALARTLGHRRIGAHHFIDNPASGAVLRKIGFRRTGRLVERFSVGRGRSAGALGYAITLEGRDGDSGGHTGGGDDGNCGQGMHRKAA